MVLRRRQCNEKQLWENDIGKLRGVCFDTFSFSSALILLILIDSSVKMQETDPHRSLQIECLENKLVSG